MTLHVPSLLATERAKCGRAVNALRACVRERDGAHVRGEGAALERKEAKATVEVREGGGCIQLRLVVPLLPFRDYDDAGPV